MKKEKEGYFQIRMDNFCHAVWGKTRNVYSRRGPQCAIVSFVYACVWRASVILGIATTGNEAFACPPSRGEAPNPLG